MKILIIKLGAIGDVIRTTSILHGLKSKYRNCMTDWITKKESFDILKNNNMINKIFLIDGNIEEEVKDKEYDLIINLDDDNTACKLATNVKHKKIIGSYFKNNEKTYTVDSSAWFDMGLISKFGKQKADKLKAKNKKTYQEILYKILGLEYKKQEPILILNELEFGKHFAEKNNIKNNDLVIGINTGAGGRWKDKKLSIEETAELIDKLNNTLKNSKGIFGELGNQRFPVSQKSKGFLRMQKISNKFSSEIKNAKLLLFGGPEEKERNEKIKNSIKTNIIDAGCNNSLMEFASLVNLCNILITSDSLAMHIGIALKKKIIAVFYPTSASEIELYNRGVKIIGKGKDYCSYKTKCDIPPEYEIDEMVDAVKKMI